MDLSDYVLDLEGKNWTALLAGWRDLLPQTFTVWQVNRFGDVFAIFEDDSIHMLDVGMGTIDRIADNRDHFWSVMEEGENVSLCFLVPLVHACEAAGMALCDSECYGFKMPPLLGGEYAVRNVSPISLDRHYWSLADVYHQTRHLPDGAKVRVVKRARNPRS